MGGLSRHKPPIYTFTLGTDNVGRQYNKPVYRLKVPIGVFYKFWFLDRLEWWSGKFFLCKQDKRYKGLCS